ncbi:MAG: ABC transporter permease [Clostridia bacterium]|nr:ABC transporter permease [Clostridia bacterium]
MKKKSHLILLIAGIALLAVGIVCFARICAVKDSIYSNYKLSFSDADFKSVFINDHDEATVKADFNAAVLKVARGGSTEETADAGAAEEALAEGAEAVEAAEETAEASEEVLEAIEESSPYDAIIGSFSKVSSLRTAWKLQSWFLIAGVALCLAAALILLRNKHLDFASIMRSKITWAIIAEILILIVCLIIRPDFFSISYQPSNRMLYGNLVDIINRSAEITIIGMGMTMVIALGGTDLSVGALVAVSGALALKLMRWDPTNPLYQTPGDYSVYPFILVLLVPLAVCLLMGAFNGVLVGQLKLQPIIATLILMVSGRGIAQIITNGKQYTTMYSPFRWIGQGSCLFLPTPIVITAVVVAAVMLFVRKTAFGTFVESVGINPSASRLSGINSKVVILIVFALTGLLSGISGMIYSSRIMSNDSNNAGLNYETDAILSVVIGGTSMTGGKFSLAGTIVGSIIIRTIVTFVYFFGIPADATMAFKALIIAVVIVLQSEPVRAWMAKRAQARAMVKGGLVK